VRDSIPSFSRQLHFRCGYLVSGGVCLFEKLFFENYFLNLFLFFLLFKKLINGKYFSVK
jgi:hypothetical protein